MILGGARSGKSAEAVRMARAEARGPILYVATAEPGDEEMRLRIDNHRAERPADWDTVEAQHDVGQAIRGQPGSYAAIIVDCVTLLVANLLVDQPNLYADETRNRVEREVAEIVEAAKEMPFHSHTIIVSNEVGAGLTPLTPLGRAYRDLLGQANQALAAAADTAILMAAGLPIVLKNAEPERTENAHGAIENRVNGGNE